MKHTIVPFLALALLAPACSDIVSPAPRDGGDDLGPLDVPSNPADATVDVTPDAPLPPDDADPACRAGAYDRCLNPPPGPCPDLSDGVERTVLFAGFGHDHDLSCAGRMTGMGPDAVLPLTVRETSDVSVTVAPGSGDTVVAALVPAGRCGDPAAERQCLNGTSAIGGIVVARAASVPPGLYYVVVATVRGATARVSASLTPARERPPGDLCPGVEVTPDGDPVSIDTRRFFTTADYGTSCGYNGTQGLGWVDAVARFTLREQRDVTVAVEGDGEEEVNVELTRVCGASSFVIPGCDTGLPARRTLHNLAPGTYWATIDYRSARRPDHTLSVRVTTAPPTPPGPASRCPGVALPEATAREVDADTLTAGPTLACLPRHRYSAFLSFTAPAEPGDVMVNVATADPRSDAALALRSPCEGDVLGECVGPVDRNARSVWARFADLAPGRTYFVQAATNAAAGALSARWVRVPHATPTPVAGNNACATARLIPPTGGIFTGTTDGSVAVAMPMCATATSGCGGSRGVVYQLDLAERRRVVAVLDGMGFDALLAIHRGDTCPGRAVFDQPACNDDWYSTDSQVDVTLNAGRYWVHAGGCGAAQSGPYRLDVAVMPP